MKRRLLTILAMAAASLAIVSCDKEREPRLDIDYPGYDILATGGMAAFAVKSNVEWTVSNADSWITEIKPAKGNADGWVTVAFAPNTDLQERSSTFTVTGGDLTKTVAIKQKGMIETLTVEYTPTEIPETGGTATFTVKSNMDWTLAVQGDAAWLTPDPVSGSGDGTVTVTVAANDGAAREGTIKVSAGSLSESVTIKQAAGVEATLTVNYTPVDIPGAGGTATFTIQSNTDWTVAAQGGATWLTPDPASGNGDATVNVTVAANDGGAREGTLNVTAGSIVVPVVINQLEAAPGAITIDDLVGAWTVASSFTTWENKTYAANHTANVVKLDANTIRIDDFLGTSTLFGEKVELDSQTFTFDPSDSTLTIIDPNTTEISWNPDNINYIAVYYSTTYAENIGLTFPVYTVVDANGVLSIDFRDPKSLDGGIHMCCVIGVSRATGETGGYGTFHDTIFTKSGTSPAPAVNNGPKADRNAPYANKAR